MSSFLLLVAFQLWVGGGPDYAYGIMIIVQVGSHANYKTWRSQIPKEHLP